MKRVSQAEKWPKHTIVGFSGAGRMFGLEKGATVVMRMHLKALGG